MSNPFLTQSLNNQNINVTSSSSLSIKMEQIKDASVLNLQAGQVLIYNGSIWQNIIPQSVVNDTIGAILDVNVFFFTKCTIFIIFISITKMDKYKYH